MTCQPWCTHHLFDDNRDLDVCIGDDLRLDFGLRVPDALAVYEASTDLSYGTHNADPAIVLHFDGNPMADLDPDQAAAIAWALLAQVALSKGDPGAASIYRDLALEHAAATANTHAIGGDR